jgi:hypothetical protein
MISPNLEKDWKEIYCRSGAVITLNVAVHPAKRAKIRVSTMFKTNNKTPLKEETQKNSTLNLSHLSLNSEKQLGIGCLGAVFEAMCDGKSVAVKVFSAVVTDKDAWKKETDLLQ